MVAIASAGLGVGANFLQTYVVDIATYPEQPGQGIPLPGTMVAGTDGSAWTFCRVAASQTIVAGDFVYISSTEAADTSTVAAYQVTSLSNSAKAIFGREVGVAGAAATTTSATVTPGKYTGIWVMRLGRYAGANVANSSATNALTYTTSTAGRINATASAGNNAIVNGVAITTTPASNTATVVVNFPFIATAQ